MTITLIHVSFIPPVLTAAVCAVRPPSRSSSDGGHRLSPAIHAAPLPTQVSALSQLGLPSLPYRRAGRRCLPGMAGAHEARLKTFVSGDGFMTNTG